MASTRLVSEPDASDAGLVAAAQAGDQHAFAELIERYQALVRSLAYGYTGDFNEREEITQQTFVVAWRRLSALRQPESFKSWLCTIAQSRGRNWYRDRRLLSAFRAGPASRESHISDEPTPLESAIDREEEAAVRRALGAIPERYRLPLILFYAEQRSIESIAQALAISPQNAKTRLWRGRKMLHAQMSAVLEARLPRLLGPRPGFTAGVAAVIVGLGAAGTEAAPTGGGRAAAGGTGVGNVIAALAASVVLAGALLARARLGPAAAGSLRPAARASSGASTKAAPPRVLMAAMDGDARGSLPGRTAAAPARSVVNLDFDDELGLPNLVHGFFTQGPPRPGNRGCIIGTLGFSPSFPEATMILVRAPSGSDTLFTYSDALVISFDYWVAGGNWLVVGAWDNAIDGGPYFATRSYVRKTWTHARLRMREFHQNVEGKMFHQGDSIRYVDITGGGGHGMLPLYVDNLKIEDHQGGGELPESSFTIPID